MGVSAPGRSHFSKRSNYEKRATHGGLRSIDGVPQTVPVALPKVLAVALYDAPHDAYGER